MLRSFFGLAILSVALMISNQAKADVLYDNGAIDGYTTASTINRVYSVSDSFTLASDAKLTGAQHVGLWVSTSATPTSVEWSLGTTAFASDLGSGTSSISGVYENSANSSLDVYDSSFSLNGILHGGTFFLTLHDAIASDGGLVYWDQNRGPSTAEQAYVGSIPSESFQLVGSLVPEPSAFALVCVGLVTGLVALRRKRAA